MTTVAVVVAGGSGQRAALGRNKALVAVAGRSVLRRSVEALVDHVDRVVVVTRPGDRAEVEQDVGALVAAVVDGGTTRHGSERAGLAAVGDDATVVAVHDAARPLVPAAVVRRVLEAAAGGAAVVPALPRLVPVARWPASVEGPVLHDALLADRSGLVGVQTPQAAPADVLRSAFALVSSSGDGPAAMRDTVEPVLRHLPDVPVVAVDGDPRNVKLTWRGDLDRLERLLEQPDAAAPRPRLHRRAGLPTGGAPLAHLEVDGVVPVTDALRTVDGDRVVAAVDRTGLVDVTGDVLALPGVLDEDATDVAAAIEAAVAAGASLRLRRRR